jgi:hypothetical protein
MGELTDRDEDIVRVPELARLLWITLVIAVID